MLKPVAVVLGLEALMGGCLKTPIDLVSFLRRQIPVRIVVRNPLVLRVHMGQKFEEQQVIQLVRLLHLKLLGDFLEVPRTYSVLAYALEKSSTSLLLASRGVLLLV